MPDEPGKTPTPRPRRRRTDIDPTFVPPKVPRERRRPRPPAREVASTEAAPIEAEPSPIPEEEGRSEQIAVADIVADAAAEAGMAPETQPEIPEDVVAPAIAADALPAAGAPAWSTDADAFGDDATRRTTDRELAAAAAAATIVTPRDDDTVDDGGPWLPMFEDRSPDPAVCPFLRAADGDRLGPPVESPDPANRCAALAEAVPQSLRQQELVCLASGHVNCPRYLRGAAETAEVPRPVVRSGRTVTPAVLASILVLIGAFALSIGFVASRGGLELAAAPGASSSAAAGVPSARPSPSPAAPSPSPTGLPSSSPAVTPAPTPTPTLAVTPTPVPTVAPTPSPTKRPAATSDRYALLVKCPGETSCWIYTVRSGDNLFSIANYFGVRLAKVYAMNPWLQSSGLRAGQQLKLPPPTR